MERQDSYKAECDVPQESGVGGSCPWQEVWKRTESWEQKRGRGKGVRGKRRGESTKIGQERWELLP